MRNSGNNQSIRSRRVQGCGILALVAVLGCIVVAGVVYVMSSANVPQPPIPNLSVSTQSAATFEEVFIRAVQQAAKDGKFNATVTQEQFSSWLAIKAPQYAQQQGQEWPFKNSQAAFKDNNVVLYSVLAQKGAPESAVQLILKPSIDSNGEFQVKVESGQLGAFGIPGAILTRVSEIIQQAVDGQMNRIKGQYKLFTLVVNNGTVSVTGQLLR